MKLGADIRRGMCTGGQRRIRLAGKRESESDRVGAGEMEPTNAEDRLALARFVTHRIEKLHITRKELAEKSNVSAATLREIEHPRKPRVLGRRILEPISKALELPKDYLFREAYLPSSEASDPVVQDMMKALAPYLEKIDAIPGLQQDVAAIKVILGAKFDIIHEDGSPDTDRPDSCHSRAAEEGL
jgi:transcriptional regulator with XRE-family HTH domain